MSKHVHRQAGRQRVRGEQGQREGNMKAAGEPRSAYRAQPREFLSMAQLKHNVVRGVYKVVEHKDGQEECRDIVGAGDSTIHKSGNVQNNGNDQKHQPGKAHWSGKVEAESPPPPKRANNALDGWPFEFIACTTGEAGHQLATAVGPPGPALPCP